MYCYYKSEDKVGYLLRLLGITQFCKCINESNLLTLNITSSDVSYPSLPQDLTGRRIPWASAVICSALEQLTFQPSWWMRFHTWLCDCMGKGIGETTWMKCLTGNWPAKIWHVTIWVTWVISKLLHNTFHPSVTFFPHIRKHVEVQTHSMDIFGKFNSRNHS